MGFFGDLEDLLVGDYDDLGLMGGAVKGAGRSPKPKKFRAGTRAMERKLNKIKGSAKLKAPGQSLFNPITGKANVSVVAPGAAIKALPVAPPLAKTVAPQSPSSIGTTSTGVPVATVSHPITGATVTAPVAKTASGGVAAIIPHPTTNTVISVPLLKAKMTLKPRGFLGEAGLDAMKALSTGSAPAPTDTSATGTDADGNPTSGTDQYGVGAGWSPENYAWLSGDLWAGNPNAWTFGGVRAQFRIAYPAIDLSALLNWSQLQEYGRVDPYNRTYDNPPAQGRDPFADTYGLDDLRWDQHPPTQTVVGIARIPTALLLKGSTDVGSWKGTAYGQYSGDSGLSTTSVQFGPIIDRNGINWDTLKSDQFGQSLYSSFWLGADPIDAAGVYFVKVPADYWKLDLSDGVPEWFHPGLPIPVDLLSWYNAKMVPDQAQGADPDKFWGSLRDVYPYQFGMSSGSLPNLGRDDDGTSDSEHGGRGSLTVYTDPADFPSHVAGGSSQPIASKGGTGTAPAPASDQYPTDAPLDTSGPMDTGTGMPPPDDQSSIYPPYDPTGQSYDPSNPYYDPYSSQPSNLIDDGSSIGISTDMSASSTPTPAGSSALPAAQEIDFVDAEAPYEDDFGYTTDNLDLTDNIQPYGTDGEDFEVMPDYGDQTDFNPEDVGVDQSDEFGFADDGGDDGTGF